MTWRSGTWDPVVSGAFWEQHPELSVRSCSLLPGFKAWAKPFPAMGWLISSWTGAGCIGRAPSLQGELIHPCCLRGACHLLRALTNWISRAVSPAPLGSSIFSPRQREPARGGLGVSCGWEERLCEEAAPPAQLREDLSGTPPPVLSCFLPWDMDWRITETGILTPGTSLFLPLGRCSNWNIREERLGWIYVSLAVALLNPRASSWLLPRSSCARSAFEAASRLGCCLLSVCLLSHKLSVFSLVLSLRAANNSRAEL